MKKPKKIFSKRMRVHLFRILMIFFLCFIFLMFRLVYIGMKDGNRFEKQVLSQQNYRSRVLPYARGEILDRNGTPLATSVKVYNLILEPYNIIEADQNRNKGLEEGMEEDLYLKSTVSALAQFFDLKEQELYRIVEENPSSYYQKILKKLEYKDVKPFKDFLEKKTTVNGKEGKKIEVKNGDLVKGVVFEEEYKRSYPNKELASNIIGFANSGNVGSWGLEQQYNSTLNGLNGREYGYINGDTQLERTTRLPVNGNNLQTTLDVNIQRIAEKHINKFMKETGAKKGVNVLIMNPNNGEILAMATDSTYDLNNPRDEKWLEKRYTKSEIENMKEDEKINAFNQIWRNESISKIFEPGSTFKPFTIAAGLEEHKLKGNENFFCAGYIKKESWLNMIKCHSYLKGGCGAINLSQAIEKSCNVALMEINDKNGKDIFTQYEKHFRFGKKTGIDLPGEELGLLIDAENMGSADLATNSFGQNVNVTMIQLASAFASLINGGHYYQPHLVKQVVSNSGSVIKNNDKMLIKDTISKETSDWLKEALYQTVEEGTGKEAKIAGYKIGGKTGTAEKHPRKEGNYLVSFISFVPVEKPQLLIYVTIDELDVYPQDQSGYSVRLGHDIMKELVTYMNIPKTENVKATSNKKK